MNYREGIQRKDWTKWTINSIQGMSYGAFYFNGQHVSEKELKELMASEGVNFDYDDFVDYLNKNLNGNELGKLLKNNIVFLFGVTEAGMHCILDMEELQTYSSSVEEGKLIIHFDLCDNINDEVWNFGCKVIFNVEIPNYNMMLEKKNLKEEKFINYIAVYNDGDCRGYVQNETPNLTQNIDRAMHFENENEANKFISKLIKRGTFSADELYVEGEYFNESIKNMKESNFKKSDAKVALQNVLKNGEEFDIPFKYSDEWEFTDAIEDELERQAFEFEGSFWDKNYGLVYEYSDGLETVYVIMDRSLSNRGICVGLVTEL